MRASAAPARAAAASGFRRTGFGVLGGIEMLEGGNFATRGAIVVPQMLADYGRCPCTGNYQRRSVEVRMNVNGKVVVLTAVPQGSCPQCGSRVYKAEVLERIEALMKGERFKRVQ